MYGPLSYYHRPQYPKSKISNIHSDLPDCAQHLKIGYFECIAKCQFHYFAYYWDPEILPGFKMLQNTRATLNRSNHVICATFTSSVLSIPMSIFPVSFVRHNFDTNVYSHYYIDCSYVFLICLCVDEYGPITRLRTKLVLNLFSCGEEFKYFFIFIYSDNSLVMSECLHNTLYTMWITHNSKRRQE